MHVYVTDKDYLQIHGYPRAYLFEAGPLNRLIMTQGFPMSHAKFRKHKD